MCGTFNTAIFRLKVFLASMIFQCRTAFSCHVSQKLGLMMKEDDGLMTNTPALINQFVGGAQTSD